MGTEVLHPLQDCFINLAPVIHNDGHHTPPEKMGSSSRRELNLKLDCENDDDNSYAGSGFFHSPSPKSLPFPSFFNKKQDSMAMVADHEATKHLCRLLRLG
ncbi:hypothetical protein L1987_55919 [Smallanthus sonchifolius]|uniref:Uncharacterized protein n=1 Tax=Smallanthus sonchifolius TaxID=185202 RepID=A0ACB9EBE8_9ASTR|nr:hypothetical protein L1987_55919 [Smallanthus sonchifolius]